MMRFSRPPLRSLRWRSVLAVAALLLAIAAPLGARAGDGHWHHGHGPYRYYRPVWWGGAGFVGPAWYGRPFVYAPPPVYYVPPPRYYAPPVYYVPAPVYGYGYGYPGPQVNVQLGFGIH